MAPMSRYGCRYCEWFPALASHKQKFLRRGHRARTGLSSLLAALGNQHCQFQRLLIIQTRVDLRAVGTLQISIRQAARPTGAFSHVLTGELNVGAAEYRA